MKRHCARPTQRSQPKRATARGGVNGASVDLEARTDAVMSGSFRVSRERRRRGTGCDDTCDAANCIDYSAILTATYVARTAVTLPRVEDYADLRPCQRTRVRNAIRNQLAPHEQEHVQAFRQYAGTTRRPFQLTACADAVDGARDTQAQEMFDAEELGRRDAANARSAALDPFMITVDLDCTDPPPGPRR